MTTYNKDRKVGAWAEEKLTCLEKYLSEYTTVLRGKGLKYFYVDAFAGGGRTELRRHGNSSDTGAQSSFIYEPQSEEEEEYIEGSPRRALNIKHPFSGYLFIEKKGRVRSQLENDLKNEFPHLLSRIRVKKGDANEVLVRDLIQNPNINWRKSRAVAFLDPYGMQLDWSTMEHLASTRAIEIIVNNTLPMGANRLIERHGAIPEVRRQKLNRYFGTDEWKGKVYQTRTGLFGDQTTKRDHASRILGKWYNERLEELFGYSAPPRVIRNTKGTEIYFLHWAGPNEVGHRIMNYIMNQGETL